MKIYAIEEAYRNHPLPPQVELVSFADKRKLQRADIFFQNNIIEQKRKKFKPHYQYILDSKKPFIVVESSVFRKNMQQPPSKNAYHRFAWFSYFQDEGWYNNHNCPPDRWIEVKAMQHLEVKPWRQEGQYILLVLQRPGDSSLKNLLKKYGTYEIFLKNVIKDIRKNTNKPIKIRLHPLRQDVQLGIIEQLNLDGITISDNNSPNKGGVLDGGDGLQKDFDNAFAVVGFNSNALTESVCEGIPTFSLCPSSMAWQCSNKDLKNLDTPKTFKRDQWLYNLAYCQWREDEIAKGLPIEHLLPLYPKAAKYAKG